MILERLVLFSLPVLLSFAAIPALVKLKILLKLEILEKFIFSLALSSAIFILFLSLYATFIPGGFKIFSWLLFILAVLAIFWSSYSYKENIKSFLKSSFYKVKKATSNPLKLLALVVFFAYLFKAIFFLIYKPIVDPDVIDSYLPFARSIFLSDNVPLKDFFSNRPIMVPPVGGFILYALSYGLTGSMLSESFRLIPLPFILGSIALVYLIAKKILGERIALLSLIIFISFPIQDETLFSTTYYPDVIFLFFSFFLLYLLVKLFWGKTRKLPKNIYLFLIGLSIIIAFFLKMQAVFLFLFLILIFIGELNILRPFLKKIVGALMIIGFFIFPLALRIRPYGEPPFLPTILLLGLMLLLFYYYLKRKIGVFDKKHLVTYRDFIGTLAVSSIGGVWLLRNLILFRHLTGNFSTQTSRSLAILFSNISREIVRLSGVPFFTESFTWPKYSWFGIFCWPFLGTFWLVPKSWGLFSVLRQRKGLLLLLWGFGWFCFWQINLGSMSRYVLFLTPFLAWVIALGVESVSRKIKAVFLKSKKISLDKIIIWMIVGGLLFGLIQSRFLWWNYGVVYYSPAQFKAQTLGVISHQTIKTMNIFDGLAETPSSSNKDNFIALAKKLVIVISANSELASEYTKELFFTGILVFWGLLLTVLALSKIKLTPKRLSRVIIVLGLILTLPYFLVFILISEGNLNQFAKFEREKVYSTWGQAKFIEPFLIKNAQKDDKILSYGSPTGLSYFTGLRVYNLEYGVAGLEIVFPILYEEDKEKVYSFLKEKGIRYFIVDSHGSSAEHFTQFKKLTEFTAILDDNQYVSQKISPTKENAWTLFELK